MYDFCKISGKKYNIFLHVEHNNNNGIRTDFITLTAPPTIIEQQKNNE